jgi:hypothetical protein
MKLISRSKFYLGSEEELSEHIGKIKNIEKTLNVIFVLKIIPVWLWVESKTIFF